MHSAEGTGKNIEQAIQNALLELKASREDVDIKILNEGGFLKKAKVLVTIAEDAREKYEKKESLKKELVEEKNDEDFAAEFLNKKIEKTKEKKVQIIADEEISDKVKEQEETPKKERVEKQKIAPEKFLEDMLKVLNITDFSIEKEEDEKFIHYNIVSEQAKELIGHHGECLFALSYILGVACEENGKRLVLDIGGYRDKRKESLIELAKRTANKVAKTGRYFKFEPMDASERKIIHTALQDDDRVTTLSKGEEPKRYLIVFPKEYKDR